MRFSTNALLLLVAPATVAAWNIQPIQPKRGIARTSVASTILQNSYLNSLSTLEPPTVEEEEVVATASAAYEAYLKQLQQPAAESPPAAYAPPPQQPVAAYANGQGYAPPVPAQGYAPPVPAQGYAPPVPAQGYAPPVPAQGYAPPVPAQGYAPPVPVPPVPAQPVQAQPVQVQEVQAPPRKVKKTVTKKWKKPEPKKGPVVIQPQPPQVVIKSDATRPTLKTMAKPTAASRLKTVTNFVTLIPLVGFLTFGPLTKINPNKAATNVAAAPPKDLPSVKSTVSTPVFNEVKASATVDRLASPVVQASPVVSVADVSPQASYQDDYGSDIVGDSLTTTLKNVKVVLANEGGDPWDESADSGNLIREKSGVTLGAIADKGSFQSSILTSSVENTAEVSVDSETLTAVANAASLSLSLAEPAVATTTIDTDSLASIATAAKAGLEIESNGVTPGVITESLVDGWSGDELTE